MMNDYLTLDQAYWAGWMLGFVVAVCAMGVVLAIAAIAIWFRR